MDFSQASLASPTAIQCSVCKTPLTESYYVAGSAIVCRSCGTLIDSGAPRDERARRVLGAIALGSLFGLGGSIVYSAIIAFTNYQLALLTILIGWLVGVGVMKGSQGVGGLGYQVMAAILTYVLSTFAFIPSLVMEMTNGAEAVATPIAVIIAIPLSLFIPLSGDMGPIGIAILAFGMWQGFKMPVEVQIPLTGPYAIAKPGAATTSAPQPDAALEVPAEAEPKAELPAENEPVPDESVAAAEEAKPVAPASA